MGRNGTRINLQDVCKPFPVSRKVTKRTEQRIELCNELLVSFHFFSGRRGSIYIDVPRVLRVSAYFGLAGKTRVINDHDGK
jgi:hypothetical protein